MATNLYCAIDNTPCDGICAEQHRVYTCFNKKTGQTEEINCPALCSSKDIPLPKKIQRRMKRRRKNRERS